jgi:hypothetical protein
MNLSLLSDLEISEIIADNQSHNHSKSMALEIQQYRRVYGPLGCEWLSDEPELTQLFDADKNDAHMTWSEFVGGVISGGLTDDDGHGVYATATHRSKITVVPSQVNLKRPEWATHVLWFNK